MLCRKFKQLLLSTRPTRNNNLQYYLISSRFSKKCVLLDSLFTICKRDRSMSTFRLILKEFSVTRFWSAWRRSYFVSTVVKRYRKDRSVRDVIQRFRQTLLRPRQTLLLSATAAYKTHGDDSEPGPSCEKNISDAELEALLKELESIEKLSRSTIYCTSCGKRLVIDKKQPGVLYCGCKESQPSEESADGWVPYMEAEDVIVWRKEYKPGQGHYAYKVYGRYKEVRAQDFAAVQVDGAYRRVWDTAVASLSVVERRANGIDDQAVLHWEVLWPRLFANRDYVYIRRHKEFDIKSEEASKPNATNTEKQTVTPQIYTERPSVHSKAKRKAMEATMRERDVGDGSKSDKVYIIMSKSCEHENAPETKHAIRVSEFWSHMVIKSLEGADEPGMEFVLTYYDEPAVGGLPSGVATWATGRAAPAFLQRMRRAANDYRSWTSSRTDQDAPDYTPFHAESMSQIPKSSLNEEEMESSKLGPELEAEESSTQDQSTQTDLDASINAVPKVETRDVGVTIDNTKDTKESEGNVQSGAQERDNNKIEILIQERDSNKSEIPAQESDSKKSESPLQEGDNKSEGTMQDVDSKKIDDSTQERDKKPESFVQEGDSEPEGSMQEGDSDKTEENKSNGSWWREYGAYVLL